MRQADGHFIITCRHVSAKAAALMAGLSTIITHKCNDVYEANNNGLHFIVWFSVICLCCWQLKSFSSCPFLPLLHSSSVPRVTQPAPCYPTWPPPSGTSQPAWMAAVHDCGLHFGSDGAHPSSFYSHVSVEESPAEQHAQ